MAISCLIVVKRMGSLRVAAWVGVRSPTRIVRLAPPHVAEQKKTTSKETVRARDEDHVDPLLILMTSGGARLDRQGSAGSPSTALVIPTFPACSGDMRGVGSVVNGADRADGFSEGRLPVPSTLEEGGEVLSTCA